MPNRTKNFVENYLKSHQHELSEILRTLRRKIRTRLIDKKNQSTSHLVTEELFDKLGIITRDITRLVHDIEELIVQLDQDKPIDLTEIDRQRIKNDIAVKETFDAFLPYLLAYSLCKNSNTESDLDEKDKQGLNIVEDYRS